MTFKEWLFSNADNPSINGQWGTLHIITLAICIAITVAIPFIIKLFKDQPKARKVTLWILVGSIITFELTRRGINLIKNTEHTLDKYMYLLLPRPWCAISCWALIIAAFAKKQSIYNFASISALLCALIFFAYPGAGFNNKYIEFENLYSISTHALLLITSISLITLKFTDFKYKNYWKVAVCFAIVFAYAFLEIYVLKIEADPLYFMPGNDVQEILGLKYPVFVVVYALFIAFYTNLFYIISDFKALKNKKEPK